MAVTDSDIEFRLSNPDASAGGAEASTPEASLGGYMSTTAVSDGVLNNLFSGVTRQQAETGGDFYRCVFVVNTHATDTWHDVVAWIQSQVPGGTDITIGLDPTGVVPADDTDPQALTIADETTAPAGVEFSNPTSIETGLPVDELGPGECFALWVRNRVPENTTAMENDGATLAVTGSSDA